MGTGSSTEPYETSGVAEEFGFGQALDYLKVGETLARRGWNGPGQWITLQIPDRNSKMNLPYIYIRTVQGNRVPWGPSQTDLLSEDWYVVI